MSDITTERLVLHPVTVEEAERIVDRSPGRLDSWADDFPFHGDVIGATMFVRAAKESGEQQPFGYYTITRRSDRRVVGAIGFKGQPREGSVEIGYGLAPSARGSGFAAEAASALVELARLRGLSRVVASTAKDNVASHITLERAGMTRTGEADGEYDYEAAL